MAMSDRAKKSNLCYLMFHGGTKVCKALFEKRMKDLKPPDEDTERWTVDKFLQIKKLIIQSKLSSEKTLILYPGAQRTTDIRSWDISILCLLLIETCVLSSVIRMYVMQIRKQRNKIAHLRDSDIDDNTYQCIFEKLKVCFEKIVLEVNDDRLKTTIENILTELKTGSIPSDELIRVEKAICQSNKDITEEVKYQGEETRKVLQKDNQEMKNMLETILRYQQEIIGHRVGETSVEKYIHDRGDQTERHVTLKLQMRICTPEAEKSVSEEIVKEMNHKIENHRDMPEFGMEEMKTAVYELQQDYKEKGRTIISAEIGCVILHIRCSSTLSLLTLIRDYMNGRLDESLKNLEKAVRSLPDCGDLRMETVLYEDEIIRVLSDLEFGQLSTLAKSVTATSGNHSDLPVQRQSLEDKVSTDDCGQFECLPAATDKSSDLLVQSRSLENADFGHFDRLAECLPKASDSHSEWKQSDSVNIGAETSTSAEVIRILLIGRTGQGKSSTANSLVGHEGLFEESTSSTYQTTTCQWSQERTFQGRRVEVVDTPGIFDSADNYAKTHKELIKSLVLTMPGFHAIAYVLKCGEKITDEFKKTQDLFFDWFGPGVENFTFIILTWCSSDEMKKEYISDDPQSKLKELVEKCGGRVTGIENKGPPNLKNRQIKLIFKAVDKIIAANGNCCFTNITYKLAQSYIRKTCPPDLIKFHEKEGLKKETLVRLGDIDPDLPNDVFRSTCETSARTSCENTDNEINGASRNLPIYDATTNERIPNIPRSEGDILKKNTTFEKLNYDRIEKMSDIGNAYEIKSGSTIENISLKKPSSRKNRRVDYCDTADIFDTESIDGSDISTLVTAVKNSVKNNDLVITGIAKYLLEQQGKLKEQIGCMIL